MDLPDCPPGAEGYEDSVVEVPKKPVEDSTCTKAELEFQEHLNSLKIKLDNGEVRCMVERRGRDISGKWIYLCYPCAAMCSGEAILQTHISGKKHKFKLSSRTVWPTSIFADHPFNHQKTAATEKVLQKMAAEVEQHKNPPIDASDEQRFQSYSLVTCQIQNGLDKLKAPVVGLEYLVEHPPEEPHHEPSYLCTLCSKQGHPRTILNHITCFWHRCNYFHRHFPKAMSILSKYKSQQKYREGVNLILNRLTQRVEDVCGQLKPLCIDKEEFDKDKEKIMQWIIRGYHFTENTAGTMEEVVDTDLIESIYNDDPKDKTGRKDPSPPIVAAPSRPFNANRGIRQRRISVESLSDISDDEFGRPNNKNSIDRDTKSREPFYAQRNHIQSFKSRYAIRNVPEKTEEKSKPVNHDYKIALAEEKRKSAEESAKKLLAYHEKNPEKHPLYPEEWKKFWNRRYKDLQAEGKDPSKHDFKPEWIVFWTKRMKELHDEELRINLLEIYRRMNLSPSLMKYQREEKCKPVDRRGRDVFRASPDRKRRSPEDRRRSADGRHRSSDPRRRSPPRRHSPEHKRRSIERSRRSTDRRERSPMGKIRRSPISRKSRSPISRRRGSPGRLHSIPESRRVRSRSPMSRRSPLPRQYSPAPRRSRSPLSRRDGEQPLRNRSPGNRGDDLAPSMQTVLISDDELGNDDLSPWNSDDMETMSRVSVARSRSSVSRARSTRSARSAAPDGADNVVGTLRMLVALEDYLGSLGPKVVGLLTEALTMEKERANSSEQLLERETALVLIETAKEKLKGAAQAGLVPAAASPAVRAAVVRAAATLHEADLRLKKKQKSDGDKPKAVPVAGVGEVDRAQIAQQMAAALIAQGKTDVTSEELAQLVDAVVGMAEAKKREAEAAKKPPSAAVADRPSGATSALQMLQSAYDENDKRLEKDKPDAIDAMDGLSDSDLETLLKNFNELSAEEQHSLIAYLKKLEAREPQRVERLRQYVTAAAAAAPSSATPSAAAPVFTAPPATVTAAPPPVAIDSDDDDYTVEEVLEAATQKVKADQIRQEMEIVKKSLQEVKTSEAVVANPTPVPETVRNQSSATDLLALVQASIQSTAGGSAPRPVDVVAPRFFGDTAVPDQPAPVPFDAGYSDATLDYNNLPAGYDDQSAGYTDAANYNEPVGYEESAVDYNQSNNFDGLDHYSSETCGQYDHPPVWNENRNFDPTNDGRDPNQGYNNFGQMGGPLSYSAGPNQFNAGNNHSQFGNPASRGNRRGGYDNRPIGKNQNQFGNNHGNFRGRGGGRGNLGRGRGRGRY